MLRRAAFASSRALRASPRPILPQPFILNSSRSRLETKAPSSLASIRATRWYSDEAKDGATASEGGDKAKEEAKDDKKEADPLAELKAALEAKDAEARDWKDKCLRTVADFRNLQDRTAREVKSARDFALTSFSKDLVESIDNLDRALTTVPPERLDVAEKNEAQQDLFNLHEGLKMTETILLQTLAKHGLERMNPEGEKFNPNEHEATFMAPQADKEDGLVFFVQQKGFKLNGRTIRAAKVGVVKNK